MPQSYILNSGGSNDTAALAAVLSTIGASVATLEFPVSPTTVLNASTIPANVTTNLNNGSLTINTGQTVTVVGPVIAATRQIFLNAVSGQGTISFAGNVTGPQFCFEWWGANPGNLSDDTAAMQAALVACGTAGGGIVRAYGGTYSYSNLIVADNYVRIIGMGWATVFARSTTTGNGLAFDNGLNGTMDTPTQQYQGNAGSSYLLGAGICDVRFQPSVVCTAGYEIYSPHHYGTAFNGLYLNGVYGGILLGRALDSNVKCDIIGLRILGATIGVKGINSVDTSGFGWLINMASTAANAYNLWLSGGCEGFNLTLADLVNSFGITNSVGANSASLFISNDAGTPTPARFNRFFGVYCDGGAYGAWLADGVDNQFHASWFHGYTDSGLLITGTAQDTKVYGGAAANSGGDGVFINSTAVGTIIEGFSAFNNNTLNVNASGFRLFTGAQNITLRNCSAGNSSSYIGSLFQQKYGLDVAVGITNLTVRDCDFDRGNVSGSYNIAATSITNVYDNNKTNKGVGDFLSVYRTTNQSITKVTDTALSFDTAAENPNAMWVIGAPTALFANTPGLYELSVSVQWASDSTGLRQISAKKNGTVYDVAQTPPLSGNTINQKETFKPVYMAIGDFVQAFVYYDISGAGPLNVEANGIVGIAATLTKIR